MIATGNGTHVATPEVIIRKYWLDYLRVIAILAVITIHVTLYYFNKFKNIGIIDWWIADILSAASRFSVPLFVMISGAVLLGRSFNIWDFYKKRAIRLLPAVFFWNFLYIGFNFYKDRDFKELTWVLKFGLFEQGYAAGHLWYLSMFCCLMLFVPFINMFLNGENLSFKQFTILFCIIFFFFLLNGISTIMERVFLIDIDWFKNFSWYFAYFIGGYYIDRYYIHFRISNFFIISVIFLIAVIGSFGNYYFAHNYGVIKDTMVLNSTGPFVFIMTFLIFLLGKRNSPHLKKNRFILTASKASFGIYLVHPVFIHFIRQLLPSYDSNGVLFIPITIVLAFFLSLLFIVLLRKSSMTKIFC